METIVDGVWHWYDVLSDLKAQGLEDIEVNPLSTRPHFTSGVCNGHMFTLTWVKDRYALLSTPEEIPELVSAFSEIFEYRPFAHYVLNQYVTFEWDREDPNCRFTVLQQKGWNPTRIEEA